MSIFKRKPKKRGPKVRLVDAVDIHIAIPRALLKAGMVEAKRRGITLSEFLRRLLREALG
jgi:hypothetical protein